MSLTKLDIYSVRNIVQDSIKPASNINLIYGDNGSGKSSIIEAIYILGRAKSFRSTSIKTVINFSETQLTVSAQTQQNNGLNLHLGVQLNSKQISCHINHQLTKKRSDLAHALPLQIIHPKSFELLDAGPQLRREFIDWGVFHDNENFVQNYSNFKVALLQRNALLKSKQVQQIDVWNKELAYYGTIVNSFREIYLLKFKPIFIEVLNSFFNINNIDLKIFPGWDKSIELHQILNSNLEKDLRYGFTQFGPHRADFLLTIDNRLAKDIVSRGQLKLFVISLKLAQMQLLLNENINQGCFLIDDFSAELDIVNREKLLLYLSKMNCQVFITATQQSEFGDLSKINNYKMFHVEHGNIKSV